MKKVACYIRVSTENQLENYSIEEQSDRLKAYCKAKDYTIYNIYTDGGYSGGNTNRPALRAMLEDLHHHAFDTVVVYKLDRLSRSQKDTLTLIEDDFLANSIDFVSVCENFDTSTPFGRAMIGILSVFAQLEKDQITERFTMGRIGRGKAGYFHGGGNAPIGYDYIDGKLEVNHIEAAQVSEVYELFLAGNSINAISKIMERKYNNGNWNNANKVSNRLKNSLYTGKVKFKGVEYPGIHQPIISEEIFRRVNDLLNSVERENAKTSAQKTPFRAGYLLSSLVYCGRCGARYSANHGYYKCYSRSKSSAKFITDPNCKNENWIIKDLDEAVETQIHAINASGNYKKLFATNNSPDEKAIQAEWAKLDAQLRKMIDLYQVSDIPVETIKQRISEINNKKEALKKMKSEFSTQKSLEEFEKRLNEFETVCKNGTTEEKRVLISSIIERITVDGYSINIKWRI